MTVADYYKHTRRLAPFRAIDAIALARQGAEMDAKRQTTPPPGSVFYETNGGWINKLSFAIKVF